MDCTTPDFRAYYLPGYQLGMDCPAKCSLVMDMDMYV